ncbi:50S ribosomal protein L9 [Thermodesulfobacteriota bacterium]
MKVILKETVDSLGIAGTTVDVRRGYARNYLLPKKKAILDTPANRRLMERTRLEIEVMITKEKALAEQVAERLEEVVLTIAAKVSDEDRLYGSVSATEILKALEAIKIEVEKNMVKLPEPIKALGSYKVPIRLYQDVEPLITVEVVRE